MTIETDRLILRSPNETMTDELLNYLERNKAFFKPWAPSRKEKSYTLNQQAIELASKASAFHEEQAFRFYLFKKEQSNTIIGDFGFSNIVGGSFLSCHLGYQMDQKEIKKGYMTEALAHGIDFFFLTKRYHRIEANIMPRNTPSINLVEKLGFVNEGYSKKYLRINGVWEDHFHYVLLNEEIE